MISMYAVFVFIFGTIIGSFLNVLVLRYNNRFLSNKRSECFSCAHPLNFLDLIPILSFLFLKGRCRYCGSKISRGYPLVELFTGLVYLYVFLNIREINPALFYYFLIWAIFIAIFVYDIKHKIIPEAMVYTLIALSLVKVSISFLPYHSFNELSSILILLSGPIVASPLAFLWLLSGGRWMGFGDIKLALAMGWLLGILGGISAMVFAFWIGAIFGVSLLLLSKSNLLLSQKFKNLTIKSEIPFAPFLILGTAIVSLGGIDILKLLLI